MNRWISLSMGMVVILGGWRGAGAESLQGALSVTFPGQAKVGEVFEIHFTLSSTADQPPLAVGWLVPEGLELVGGDGLQVVTLHGGESRTFQAQVLPESTGIYEVGVVIFPGDTARDTLSVFELLYHVSYLWVGRDTAFVLDSVQVADSVIRDVVNPFDRAVANTGVTLTSSVTKGTGTVQGDVVYGPGEYARAQACVYRVIDLWNGGKVYLPRGCVYTDSLGQFSLPGAIQESGTHEIQIRAANQAGRVFGAWKGKIIHYVVGSHKKLDLAPGVQVMASRRFSGDPSSNFTFHFDLRGDSVAVRQAKILEVMHRVRERIRQEGLLGLYRPIQVNDPGKVRICIAPVGIGCIWKEAEFPQAFAVDLFSGRFTLDVIGGGMFNMQHVETWSRYIVVMDKSPVHEPYGSRTLTHEIGHTIQYMFMNTDGLYSRIPYGRVIQAHYPTLVSNPGHAFREGFADFWAQAVWEEYGVYGGLYELFAGDRDGNQTTDPPFYIGDTFPPNPDGRKVEGAVMQYLWDLVDDAGTLDGYTMDDERYAVSLGDVLRAMRKLARSMTNPRYFEIIDTTGTFLNVPIWHVRVEGRGYVVPRAGDSLDFMGVFRDSLHALVPSVNTTTLYNVVVHPFQDTARYPLAAPSIWGGGTEGEGARVHWNPVAGAGHYLVWYKRVSSSSWNGPYRVPPESTAFTIPDFSFADTVLVKVRYVLADTSAGAVDTLMVNRLAPPTNVQVQVVDSGLGFSWQDRSNYETRYMLKVRAFSWGGDTLEGAKYLTGTNGTSGFVAWDDAFWDFVPAGTALKKIVVGVYAARDTVIHGQNVSFFSDVVWAETLRPAPPTLVNIQVIPDSGIRIQWDGAPVWVSHVAVIHPTMFPEETSWGPQQ